MQYVYVFSGENVFHTPETVFPEQVSKTGYCSELY